VRVTEAWGEVCSIVFLKRSLRNLKDNILDQKPLLKTSKLKEKPQSFLNFYFGENHLARLHPDLSLDQNPNPLTHVNQEDPIQIRNAAKMLYPFATSRELFVISSYDTCVG
jgi:hypothetical protein